MVWEVVAAAYVASTSANEAAIAEQRRQFDVARSDLLPYRHFKPSGPSIEQAAHEHRQRMDAMHAETMRANAALVIVSTAEKRSEKSGRAKFIEELLAIRQRAIARGMKLQSMDEIRSDIEAARELDA